MVSANSEYADEVPCRDCKQLIVWMLRPNSEKKVPVDASTVVFGQTVFDMSKGHRRHDCPARSNFHEPTRRMF